MYNKRKKWGHWDSNPNLLVSLTLKRAKTLIIDKQVSSLQ